MTKAKQFRIFNSFSPQERKIYQLSFTTECPDQITEKILLALKNYKKMFYYAMTIKKSQIPNFENVLRWNKRKYNQYLKLPKRR